MWCNIAGVYVCVRACKVDVFSYEKTFSRCFRKRRIFVVFLIVANSELIVFTYHLSVTISY